MEQLLTNYSIETQTKSCEDFAFRIGFNDIKYMGGVSESAKDGNRKIYNEMLRYAMDKRNNIQAIIVYSMDRFSRHLASAAPDIEKLNKKNIILYSVQEQISSNDDMGIHFMNFKLSSSQFENRLRSSRARDGVRNRILMGKYPFATPPIGYNKDSDKNLVINEDGELLRKAFKMLLDGYSMMHIMKVMSRYGIIKPVNRWGEIFRNPIYAGLIVSKTNDNKPIKGIHQPIVSEKDFYKLQGIFEFKSKPRLKETDTIDIFPLKTLLQCPNGHGRLTGDIKKTKKNQPAYYKCNKCSFTASAQKANNAFLNLLSVVEFNQVFKDEFKEILDAVFENTFQEMTVKKNKLAREISIKETQLTNLFDAKFAEKINENKFEILSAKYTQSLEDMQKQLVFVTAELPEKKTFIEDCLIDLNNFEKLWDVAEYMDKQQIFNTIFKEKPSIVNNNHKIGLSNISLNPAFRSNLVELVHRKAIITGNY
ncbi:site-specific recombinase [Cytophaga hutchinsonii ATCC 33406]|uniref:Site-specific recombinase n=2 Tax=Cytophaga hutchinsonii TaxID=985 RepID=A0A6N4SUW0_CYTH3|nr:site-specific recombinase [Cytophaga hutchinsonii ATCC 33406]